ncbi:MAG: hypothetical protein WCJ25_00235 [Candidatus Moraniibacteriota bacterium]
MEKVILPHFNPPTDTPSVVPMNDLTGVGSIIDLSRLNPGEFLNQFRHLLSPPDPFLIIGLVGTTVIHMMIGSMSIAINATKIILDCIAMQLQDDGNDDDETFLLT